MSTKKKKVKKVRVDELLLRQELVEDRAEAQKYILAGFVRTHADHVVRKATDLVPEDTVMSLDLPMPYVSRGAYKLKDALEKYSPDMSKKIAMDVGASTGGFTDLMLQSGCPKVFAVDVGHSQLHYKLRNDDRVICLEKTNARYLTREIIPDEIDVMTSDVSFISVTLILPSSDAMMKSGALAFILVKPQFEVEKKDVGDGVIRDVELQLAMVEKVKSFAQTELSWECLEVIPSALKGPKGNQEYVCVFKKP